MFPNAILVRTEKKKVCVFIIIVVVVAVAAVAVAVAVAAAAVVANMSYCIFSLDLYDHLSYYVID
jgi:hypothetical protein